MAFERRLISALQCIKSHCNVEGKKLLQYSVWLGTAPALRASESPKLWLNKLQEAINEANLKALGGQEVLLSFGQLTTADGVSPIMSK